MRKQIEEIKAAHSEEVKVLRERHSKGHKEWNKERFDLQRKIKELEGNVQILEIDRRNFLSSKDSSEAERIHLQNERDTLIAHLQDTEIHQLANKYKLDRVSDDLGNTVSKLNYVEAKRPEMNEINQIIRKAVEQLKAVREDMGKAKELEKTINASIEDSSNRHAKSRSALLGSELVSDIMSKKNGAEHPNRVSNGVNESSFDGSKTDISSNGSPSPTGRRKLGSIFATLRRGRVKEKRMLFSRDQSSSVESTDLGQTIGALGMQTVVPGIDSSSAEKVLHNPKLDPKQKRSNSATRLLAKLRRRSKSRDSTTSQKSVDTDSKQSADESDEKHHRSRWRLTLIKKHSSPHESTTQAVIQHSFDELIVALSRFKSA
ncbi:unnamed protein product [Soboliphyme baturini]|uniref:PH domain-containing protein n=1 Tax=Soboliphyme baturini TaxID=241478 RepID=A0A183IR59_9BILA|nr:unnamed protein product [Soboliphyme baturini]